MKYEQLLPTSAILTSLPWLLITQIASQNRPFLPQVACQGIFDTPLGTVTKTDGNNDNNSNDYHSFQELWDTTKRSNFWIFPVRAEIQT